MARQTGILKFKGQMGGLSFYYHKRYGWLVRQCNPVSAERIRKDPAFELTRQNNSELGATSTNAALLRNGLTPFLKDVSTEGLDNRLMRFMCGVRNHDTVSDRGKRRVSAALGINPGLLGGFEFHETDSLWKYIGQEPAVDVVAGTVSLREFVPNDMPPSATHLLLTCFRGRLDFDGSERNIRHSETLVLPLDDVARDVEIFIETPDVETGIEIWGMKVVFVQEVNGEMCPLRVGAAKVLSSNHLGGDDGEIMENVHQINPVAIQSGGHSIQGQSIGSSTYGANSIGHPT